MIEAPVTLAQRNVQRGAGKMIDPQYLTQRHGVWHFLRRMPVEYEHLDTRGDVTKIKLPPTAPAPRPAGSRPE